MIYSPQRAAIDLYLERSDLPTPTWLYRGRVVLEENGDPDATPDEAFILHRPTRRNPRSYFGTYKEALAHAASYNDPWRKAQ